MPENENQTERIKVKYVVRIPQNSNFDKNKAAKFTYLEMIEYIEKSKALYKLEGKLIKNITFLCFFNF